MSNKIHLVLGGCYHTLILATAKTQNAAARPSEALCRAGHDAAVDDALDYLVPVDDPLVTDQLTDPLSRQPSNTRPWARQV